MVILHSFMYEDSFKSTKEGVKGFFFTGIAAKVKVIVPHSLKTSLQGIITR